MEKNYKKAIETFVDEVKKDSEIIGILIAGSYVKSEMDENSDIDIHLILDERCNYRERGNTWINGVEIEYFKNPPKQIRSYFVKEKESPHTADMFVNSLIVYKNSEVIDDLIEEAKNILEKNKPNPIKDFEVELSKYFLDDVRKDLMDCIVAGDKTNFAFVKNKLIDECVSVMLKLHQIRKTKRKRLLAQLKYIDSKFANLVEKAIDENLLEIEKVNNLVEYTESKLGGRRNREWVFRSELDL